jgi:hypothetical protein
VYAAILLNQDEIAGGVSMPLTNDPSRIMHDSISKQTRNHINSTHKLCVWILCPILGWIVLGLTLWGILWLCRL